MRERGQGAAGHRGRRRMEHTRDKGEREALWVRRSQGGREERGKTRKRRRERGGRTRGLCSCN